jgi:hypothetical protein
MNLASTVPRWSHFCVCGCSALTVKLVSLKPLLNLMSYVLPYTLYLPSPRRYSSGRALASWIICLHFFSILHLPLLPSFHFHFSDVDFRSIHSSEAEHFSFYSVRLLTSRPNHNLEDQGIPFRLAPTPWPVRHGWSTSSYATAGIALRVSGALKPHHHDKVETPSVAIHFNLFFNFTHFHISLSLLDQNINLPFLPWKFYNFESEKEENYTFRYFNPRLDGD